MDITNTSSSRTRSLIYCALGAAFISVSSLISIPLPFSPTPITLQTFAVFLCALLFGKKIGTVCVAIYLLLGVIGLPVYAGFQSGLGTLVGVNGGFLIGFLPAAFLVGYTNYKFSKLGLKKTSPLVAMLIGETVINFFGVLQVMFIMHIGLIEAISISVVPFLLGEAFKIILVIIVLNILRRYSIGTN